MQDASPRMVSSVRLLRALVVCVAIGLAFLAFTSVSHALEFNEVQQVPAQRWDFGAAYDSGLDASGTLWVALANHVEAYDSEGRLVRTSNKLGSRLLLDGEAMWGLTTTGLKKFDRDFNVVRSIAPPSDGQPHNNRDIAVGPNDTLYMTDNTRGQIRVYDASGVVVDTLPLPDAQCVAVDDAGRVVATRARWPLGGASESQIVEFSAEGSAVSAFACQDASGTSAPPMDILIADDGSLLVTVPGAIWHFARDGAWLGVFAQDPMVPANYGGRLHQGPNGSYSWCEVNERVVHILDHQGNLVRTVGARVCHIDWFTEISGLAFDATGNGYVADQGAFLHKFSPAGDIVQQIPLTVPSPGAQVTRTKTGVAVDAAGYIYSADPAYDVQAISRHSPSGAYLGRLYGSEFASYLRGNGLAFGPDGALYATANMSVVKFDAQFGVAKMWRSCWPQLKWYVMNEPLAVSSGGEVLVGQQFTSQTEARVLRYTLDGAPLGEFGFNNGPSPPQNLYERVSGIAVAPDGTIFVADNYNVRVQYFSAQGVYLGDLSAGWLRPFTKPGALAFDPSGRLWVADGNAMRCFELSGTGAPRLWRSPAVGTTVTKVSVSTSRPKRGRPVLLTAVVSPISAASKVKATLRLYRQVSRVETKKVRGRKTKVTVRTWQSRGSVPMRASGGGRLTAKYRFPRTGHWKVMVFVAGGAEFTGCQSLPRVLTVR